MKSVKQTNKQSDGFTIVELLIVIVVIGILAAITIVAYNNIQDRARASTIVSDLGNASKQLQIWQTFSGSSYPNSNSTLRAPERPIPERTWTRSPDPYDIVLYCSDGDDYLIAARQAGVSPIQWYMVGLGSGVDKVDIATPSSASATNVCTEMGLPESSSRYATWLKNWTSWSL